jgi:hypothetical protein
LFVVSRCRLCASASSWTTVLPIVYASRAGGAPPGRYLWEKRKETPGCCTGRKHLACAFARACKQPCLHKVKKSTYVLRAAFAAASPPNSSGFGLGDGRVAKADSICVSVEDFVELASSLSPVADRSREKTRSVVFIFLSPGTNLSSYLQVREDNATFGQVPAFHCQVWAGYLLTSCSPGSCSSTQLQTHWHHP